LARTGDVAGLIAEVAGRSSGASGGYGGSQHLGAPRFYSNGIQGGMTTVAAGLAAAAGKQKSIAACFMGDGTLGEGAFYESMNLASRWGLPVLYVIEDNGYAQSTSARQTTAGTVEGRAKAFEIHYVASSTDNLEALNKACERAVSQARNSGKPVILHVKTQRLNSHSKGDDNRADAELESCRQQDVLNRLLRESAIPMPTSNPLKPKLRRRW
jgi:2-oxoisovalerate dehydrogenase E1 component